MNIYYHSFFIYNIDDSDSLLVIASKKSKTWKWGNIYIHPDVTNIDAVLVADRSLISMGKDHLSNNEIYIAEDNPNQLRTQLLIYGSVLSSNSVWTNIIPYWADYYETLTNNEMNSSIYDLWNLRTFNLNYWTGSVDGDTLDSNKIYPIIWSTYLPYAWAWRCKWYNKWSPWYNSSDCELLLRKSEKKNPLIIEYNPHIKQIAPYILQQH